MGNVEKNIITEDQLDDYDSFDEQLEDESRLPIEAPEEESIWAKSSNARILSLYDSITNSADVSDALATMLSIMHTWGWSLRHAQVVNHRQGKNRSVYDADKFRLIKESYELDTDAAISRKMDDLFVTILNSYFATKAKLPDGINARKATKTNCAVALIMLFKNNQFGIIPRLKIPEYATKWIEYAFTMLQNTKENVYYNWVEQISESENEFLVDYINSVGLDLFEISETKAIDLFNKYFGDFIEKIKDYDGLRESYNSAREEIFKVINGVNQNVLYDKFEITESIFMKSKSRVIAEFQDMFSVNSEDNLHTIKRLIYGE